MKMIRIIALLALVFATGALQSQPKDKSNRPSPPRTAQERINGSEVTIDYSSPAVKNRTVWGDLVPYGKVWRTGANEATTISFQDSVTIGGTAVAPGKYALFTIPDEKEWTVIINSVWDQWGSYNYDMSKDVVRFKAKPKKTKDIHERLAFTFRDGNEVVMNWEYLELAFELE